MNIAEIAISRSTVTVVFTVLMIFGGVISYQQLGRLEDPEFTIKEARVYTAYPGASAEEVAEEVTDTLETAIQQMGQLYEITSISQPGLSTIAVEMKDSYDKHSLPQVWDELRRKVFDAQFELPQGATPSVVFDDFGDVYGVFFAIYGDGYSSAELYDYAKLLRRELLLCDDVAKVSLSAIQQEVIYLESPVERFSQFGIAPQALRQTLAGQNAVAPAGRVTVGSRYVRIDPTGEFLDPEDIANLLILQPDGSPTRLRLGDVFTIKRGYVDPPTSIMRYNGHPAIGIGISTVQGGNVITMGKAVDKRLAELQEQTPIGIEIGTIAHQATAVTTAINGFMISLAEAVAIVIAVLMIAMGLRSGLLIGFVLVLTVLATFIVMQMQGIMLERVSLGALIIALGMLVDNAIVVVEGILVGAQGGQTKREAAIRIVKQTTWPLFGATIVAIMAFASIGVSQDSTGEFCRSLFLVILISLMLSWVLAITVTPLLGMWTLRINTSTNPKKADPYGGIFFAAYRGTLAFSMRHMALFLLVMFAMLIAAVIGFGSVKQSFFPDSTRPQFMVHFWMPQGTDIRDTESALLKAVDAIRAGDHELLGDLVDPDTGESDITDISMFVGGGTQRFILTYAPEEANTAYGMLLIGVKDYTRIKTHLMPAIQAYMHAEQPEAQAFCRPFVLGPGDPSKIHVRVRGPDPEVLRVAAAQVRRVMEEEPEAVDITDDWRQRTPLIQPRIAEMQARNLGITRGDIASAIQSAIEGETVGYFREDDELLPIRFRLPQIDRSGPEKIENLQIWSPAASQFIPIGQVLTETDITSENAIVRRFNRLPCITIKCDPLPGLTAEPVRQKLAATLEKAMASGKIHLPTNEGYSLEWGGEFEDSTRAQAALFGNFPIFVMLMLLTVIVLFNSIRQPLAIFLTVPLAIIGVTVGLLLLDQPFGFMALLGFMSLMGMLIKNAIVLVDEINLQIAEGKPRFTAILDSGTSRLRPVSMAALTTVLGMIPLLADAFFVAMAVTIMFGLTFATVLTLLVVPVLYTLFYRVKPQET